MQKFKLLLVLFLLFGLITFNTSLAQSDPIPMLQSIANNMVAELKANRATLKSKPQIVYNLAYKYVVPHADVSLMAKHVLPPQTWKSATPNQRTQFEKEFTTTLIRTYASALTAYRDQKVKFYPVRNTKATTLEVKSEIISSESDPVHVSYRLVQESGDWKLYDLSVEGVSMLESFRAQFADILSQGNMERLLQRMSGHNNRHV